MKVNFLKEKEKLKKKSDNIVASVGIKNGSVE
jgi:hypothetical protein